jgi:RecA-family ATPase
VLFIDSLGAAVSADVSSNVEVKSFYKFLAKIRHDFDVAVWIIHHGRKATNDNQAPKGLSDMYGSVYIGAEASSVFCLYPTKDVGGSTGDPMLKVVKSRFATDKTDKVLYSDGIRFVTKSQKEVKSSDSSPAGDITSNTFLGIGEQG